MARAPRVALSLLVITAALAGCITTPETSDAGPIDAPAEGDLDGDGIPDSRDSDVDGDGIENVDELGADGSPVDTDGDGTPDLRDLDSDGDTIPDSVEGNVDHDGDGVPSFRDLDSDDDRVADAIEAGDAELETAPRTCATELDPDELADFIDLDSDGDGLADGEEAELGTDPCDLDSDDDDVADLDEGAYERVRCADGVDCGCATSAACQVPPEHLYVVLPFGAASRELDVELDASLRAADIFFLTDTTTSMGGTLENVKRTIAAPGTGLITRIGATIPGAWIGGAQHDDFALGSYGGAPDEPLIVALRMTPLARAADIAAAFMGISLHGGGDRPESQTESLYQTITGEGGTWRSGADASGVTGSYSMRRYAGDCLAGTWGAPCFRDAALPIIVLFTDICSHNGPPDEDRAACDDYVDITPAPALWTDTMTAMSARGAKLIGVNASGASCAEIAAPGGWSPCWFLRRTAEATGAVDLEGRPLVYDLPNAASASEFSDTIAGAIETLATQVRHDVHTQLRDDPTDALGIDARGFISTAEPACERAEVDVCWQAPPGIEHAEAVEAHDASTFSGVVPGTRVTFRVTFENDSYEGGPTADTLLVTVELRADGGSVLDSRDVFVVIPANDGSPVGGWRDETK